MWPWRHLRSSEARGRAAPHIGARAVARVACIPGACRRSAPSSADVRRPSAGPGRPGRARVRPASAGSGTAPGRRLRRPRRLPSSSSSSNHRHAPARTRAVTMRSWAIRRTVTQATTSRSDASLRVDVDEAAACGDERAQPDQRATPPRPRRRSRPGRRGARRAHRQRRERRGAAHDAEHEHRCGHQGGAAQPRGSVAMTRTVAALRPRDAPDGPSSAAPTMIAASARLVSSSPAGSVNRPISPTTADQPGGDGDDRHDAVGTTVAREPLEHRQADQHDHQRHGQVGDDLRGDRRSPRR